MNEFMWWNDQRNIRNFKALTAASLSWIVGGATAATVGSQQYSASKASTAAKKQSDHLNSEAKRIEAENKAAAAKAAADIAGAEKQASMSVAMRNRARARSQTVYTSPLGLTGQPSTTRKTLLGQ